MQIKIVVFAIFITLLPILRLGEKLLFCTKF